MWQRVMAMALAAMGPVAVGVACTSAARADDAIDVAVRDGRVLRGVIDPRTDDVRLWIRQDEGAIVLASSADWSDVISADQQGTALSIQELRERSAGATAGPRWFAEAAVPPAPRATTLGSAARRALGALSPRVRSVEIVGACLANLDSDVEPDGLLVSVAALDDRGAAVAIRGSMTAQLTGERSQASSSQAAFGVLDRWTRPVAMDDFVDGVATFELRFRRTAPEWQFALMPDAVLDVQLGVFGEGDFSASAPVVLRQFNPLRDSGQLQLGTRFVPGEQHGRNPLSMPVRRDGQWLHWAW